MSTNIGLASIPLAFSDPELIKGYSDSQWEAHIRILRGSDLLASFYYALERTSLLKYVPDFALKHLTSAKMYADRQSHQIKQEAAELDNLLGSINIKPIFLKGSAYVLRDDVNHFGRVMSDMDILVRKSELDEVEKILRKNNWIEKKLDNYDEQYYRKWAHEIPPYVHAYRGTTLDIHHTLIPPISGVIIPESILFTGVTLTKSNIAVLSNQLVVLHCMIHLFFNEEFNRSFRDVWDLHLLMSNLEFTGEISDFVHLAKSLGFGKEVFYTISLCDIFFDKNYGVCLSELRKTFNFPFASEQFVCKIVRPAVMPSHDLIPSKWNSFSQFVMYMRGHLLKMPLRVLIPHTIVKFYRAIIMSVMGAHHFEK
jgi:hypothetical protein